MEHIESLYTTEESAFLRIDNSLMNVMSDMDIVKHQGSLAEDKELLMELFGRHHFVKASLRIEANLIGEIPDLSRANQTKKETFMLRRKNSPSKRPIIIP